MIQEYFAIVIKNIANRKLRVGLTVIGIVVGIAAIVSLLTLSQALQNSLEQQVEEFGGNSLTILSASFDIATSQTGTGLTIDDVEAIESLAVVERATGYVQEFLPVTYRDETKLHALFGVPADKGYLLEQDFNLEFRNGRTFDRHGEGVVLGFNVAEDRFERRIKTGNSVEIGEQKFKVIGLLEKENNPDTDNTVFIPLEDLREITGKREQVSYIDARVVPSVDVEDAKDRVIRRLKRVRDESSFIVWTARDILNTFNQTFSIVQGVLLSIAAISLLVGTIGIANAVYSSVSERINQIGLMKAVGATQKDILSLFVMEASIIGLVGGIVGSILGILAAIGVEYASRNAGLDLFSVSVTPTYIFIGIASAVLSGALAGIAPAKRAAKLHPVTAMRKK